MVEVDNLEFKNEMVKWEERYLVSKFKFGVVYCAAGQITEQEMFNNAVGSEQFEEFLDAFTQKIPTKGWTNYAGGLNIKQDLDGIHSRYCFFENFEVMFHVSTYLRYSPTDLQQLERKRHIGNDVVVLVYTEGDQALDPGFIRSQFNHVYVVVRPVVMTNRDSQTPSKTVYRIGVVAKHGVVPFGPYLQQDKLYEKEELRDFLLTKLINAERAALHASAFRDRIVRTRQTFLSNLVATYVKPEK